MKIDFRTFCIEIVMLQLAKIVESQMTFNLHMLHFIIWRQWRDDYTDPQHVVLKSSYSKLMEDWNDECANFFDVFHDCSNPFRNKYEFLMEMIQLAILEHLIEAIRDVQFHVDDPLKDVDISNMSLTKEISEKILDRFKYSINKKYIF